MGTADRGEWLDSGRDYYTVAGAHVGYWGALTFASFAFVVQAVFA